MVKLLCGVIAPLTSDLLGTCRQRTVALGERAVTSEAANPCAGGPLAQHTTAACPWWAAASKLPVVLVQCVAGCARRWARPMYHQQLALAPGHMPAARRAVDACPVAAEAPPQAWLSSRCAQSCQGSSRPASADQDASTAAPRSHSAHEQVWHARHAMLRPLWAAQRAVSSRMLSQLARAPALHCTAGSMWQLVQHSPAQRDFVHDHTLPLQPPRK